MSWIKTIKAKAVPATPGAASVSEAQLSAKDAVTSTVDATVSINAASYDVSAAGSTIQAATIQAATIPVSMALQALIDAGLYFSCVTVNTKIQTSGTHCTITLEVPVFKKDTVVALQAVNKFFESKTLPQIK